MKKVRFSCVVLALLTIPGAGCDNAAKQQRDNDVHRSAIAKELKKQGESQQMQLSENETNDRHNDHVSEAADD
ncbi:hypothetical protein [Thalassoglobus neptunius]|uniref:hypothetical protein n=1 Tax=Thalassoglobus neptunius TaxID=1938619 RepID=UPI0011B3A57F|nr:hypothetical protein [Thalassoglobus neptunius]